MGNNNFNIKKQIDLFSKEQTSFEEDLIINVLMFSSDDEYKLIKQKLQKEVSKSNFLLGKKHIFDFCFKTYSYEVDDVDKNKYFIRSLNRLQEFGFDFNFVLDKKTFFELYKLNTFVFSKTNKSFDILGQNLLLLCNSDEFICNSLIDLKVDVNPKICFNNEFFTEDEMKEVFPFQVNKRNFYQNYQKIVNSLGAMHLQDFAVLYKKQRLLNLLSKKNLILKEEQVEYQPKLSLQDLVDALKKKDQEVLNNLNNFKDIILNEKIRDKTFLFFAVEYGNLEVVKFIVENKLVSKNDVVGFSGYKQDIFYQSLAKKKSKIVNFLYEKKWFSDIYYTDEKPIKRSLLINFIEEKKYYPILADIIYYDVLKVGKKKDYIELMDMAKNFERSLDSKDYNDCLIKVEKKDLEKTLEIKNKAIKLKM